LQHHFDFRSGGLDETQKVTEIKTANEGTDLKKIFNDEQEDFLKMRALK